jgi:hypothetical protein
MKTFSLFLEDTGYQGGTAPIVEPPKVDPVSGTSLVKSEDDPMKEEDTDDIDEVAAIRSVNKELADIALDDLDEALEKIQEVLATIGVTFDQESAKSTLGSSDQIEVALYDNPTDVAEPIAIYGKDDEGNEEPGELTLCIHKDDDDYKAYLHVYFGEEKMRLSDISLEDKDGEDNATDLTSKYTDSEEMSEEEGEEDKTNPVDVVKMDIPLFIRMLEFAREDAVDDEQLHAVTERITKMAAEGNIITMAEYDKIVGVSTEEKESEDPNKDPNASEIKKKGHIEVYESKSKSLESFLKESSEDDSPQVVVYLKGKDVRSKVVKNKHAAHLVIKTEKADGIISITPVDTDEINKAKDQADTVKKDAKVKAKKKLENEEKKASNPKSMMDEAPAQRVIHVTDKSGKTTDIQIKPNVGDATLLDMIATTRKKYPNHKLEYSENGGMKEPLGEDEGQGIPPYGSKNMEMDQTDKDRGSSRNPHKFVNGKKIPLTDPKEIADYDAAYKGASTDKGTDNARPRGATDRQYGEEMQEEDSAKVIGDIVKIASGPMKELTHGNDLHKVIDVQDGKLLIQPWDQETEKPFPLKNIKYPHSAVLVDAADITSHDLLGMDIRLKEEGEGDDQYAVHNGEKNEEDEEEDDDSLTRPMTH